MTAYDMRSSDWSSYVCSSNLPICAEPIATFRGCIARAYDAELASALDRLLIAAGFAPQRPVAQTCCGTVHLHAGNTVQAAVLAKTNARAFAGCRTVVSTASGCHARSEERRVGTECVRTFSSRWSPYQ